MNKFHRVDKLPCGECKQKFDSFDEMDLHHHLVHGRDGEFACDKCEKILNSADSIKLHMERVHDQTPPWQECNPHRRLLCLLSWCIPLTGR